MAQWAAKQGEAFMRPSGPTPHLFVVLGAPAVLSAYGYGSIPKVISVNVSSIKNGVPHDTSCVLMPGCHPFITLPSFVWYRSPCVEDEAHVNDMVNKGIWPAQPPVSAQILTSMLDGLCASNRIAAEMKRIFGCKP